MKYIEIQHKKEEGKELIAATKRSFNDMGKRRRRKNEKQG